VLRDEPGLGALAGPGRTHQHQPHGEWVVEPS
jgi:hypothetical protein